MDTDSFLQIIHNNNRTIDPRRVEKVMIVINYKSFPIGDSVVNFSQLRPLQSYLKNASFDVCTTHVHYSLLKNNPFVEKVFFEIEEVEFSTYDLILFFSTCEQEYLSLLASRYGASGGTDFKASVFSLITFPIADHHLVLPVYESFINFVSGEYLQTRTVIGQELFISGEEKAWAEAWLSEKGLKEDEKLIVMIDNSSTREKNLPPPVYFDVIDYFLSFEKVKILVFDEKNIGKEDFYRMWLSKKAMENFLFVKGLSLREATCLLASDYTKVVFGPCTGLLHCASGIYNVFLNSQMPFKDVPLMITYISPDQKHNKWSWWGESLVACLFLETNAEGQKQISRLTGPHYNCLPCEEYSSELLIDYLDKHFMSKLLSLGIRLKSKLLASR